MKQLMKHNHHHHHHHHQKLKQLPVVKNEFTRRSWAKFIDLIIQKLDI